MVAQHAHGAAQIGGMRRRKSLIRPDDLLGTSLANAVPRRAVWIRRRREARVNALGTLLTVLAVIVGAVLLIPVLGVVLGLAVAFGGVLLWLLPIVLIAASDKVGTAEKILWILAIIFLSWFAWIFYFFFAPVFDKPQRHSYY
jgi:hypothetical protein